MILAGAYGLDYNKGETIAKLFGKDWGEPCLHAQRVESMHRPGLSGAALARVPQPTLAQAWVLSSRA